MAEAHTLRHVTRCTSDRGCALAEGTGMSSRLQAVRAVHLSRKRPPFRQPQSVLTVRTVFWQHKLTKDTLIQRRIGVRSRRPEQLWHFPCAHWGETCACVCMA